MMMERPRVTVDVRRRNQRFSRCHDTRRNVWR